MNDAVGVDADLIAEFVERLALLLESGIAPAAAWRLLSADGFGPIAASVAARDLAPSSILAGLLAAADSAAPAQAEPLRVLGAVWSVAVAAGAPLAPTLAAFAATLRDQAQESRDIEAVLAGPRATSRLVLGLPPLGLLSGALLGIDALGTLIGTPFGVACLVAGAGLVLIAVRWNRRLVGHAARRSIAPGVDHDLVAVALAGGIPPGRAVATARTALEEADLDFDEAEVERILGFARSAGIPAGPLLRSAARAERRRAGSEARRRAAVLGTRLVLPLGVCVLPAFVLVGVVPLGLAIVSSTALGG